LKIIDVNSIIYYHYRKHFREIVDGGLLDDIWLTMGIRNINIRAAIMEEVWREFC